MLENCRSIKERWGGVSKILDSWLQQRQELIVEFCTVSGVHDIKATHSRDTEQGLRQLCELVVDYISAGHFEVYDHLIQEAEALADSNAMEAARQLYPQISQTTEQVLAFNDDYDAMLNAKILDSNLARELSKLGETLVARFELEDQLVETLHYAHRDWVANA